MDVETIRKLSEEGEREYLEVPPGGHTTGRTFTLDQVKSCFSKPFAFREGIYVVGSCATHPNGEANDVDLIVFIDDFSEDLKSAVLFRLYRAFSSFFNIPYDNVTEFLHIHIKETGKSPFTDWVPLYKFGSIPVSDEERTIHSMSYCNVIEKSSQRIIGGIISNDSIDLENERITPEALKQIWDHIKSLDEKYRGLMISHSSVRIGTILMEYKGHKSELREDGLYLLAELRDDLDVANQTWEKILNGELHGFSIKIEIPEPVEDNIRRICDQKKKHCWTELLAGSFIEFSVTSNPACEKCNYVDIYSKST